MEKSDDEEIKEQVLWCAFSPGGSRFVTAAGYNPGNLRLFDTETRKCLKSVNIIGQNYPRILNTG